MPEFTDKDYRAFVKLVQSLALRAYPNPERDGCPGAAIIHDVAIQQWPADHPVFQFHICRCSPCIAAVLEERKRFQRQQRDSHNRRIAVLVGAFAAFCGLVLGSWYFVGRNADHPPASKKSVEPPSATSASVEVPASIILRPGLSRAATSNESPYELLIHPGPSAVSIILRMDRDPCPIYNAIVQRADGQDAQRIDDLKAQVIPNIGKALVISLSSESLQNNTYQIKILGECRNRPEEFVDIYAFRVIKS